MSSLWKIARTTRRAASASSAVKRPGAYARRRATSKALGKAGVWSALSRIMRG